MVLLGGPRQVGKTTLARRVLGAWESGVYLSWDNREDRGDDPRRPLAGRVRARGAGRASQVAGVEELAQGRVRQAPGAAAFLVTGSARLDVYRRGGDSLQGRYHHHRLAPLLLRGSGTPSSPDVPSPGASSTSHRRATRTSSSRLLQYGGFPEPFLARSPRTLRRWQKERLDRFFREDVRDLEPVRDLSTFQLLADLLPERVGSLLSLNALREDLEVGHRALTHWMDVLETMYHVFRVRPFAGPRSRLLGKMPKAYLWDSSLVPARAARFENLVASHLLELCHFLEDTRGTRWSCATCGTGRAGGRLPRHGRTEAVVRSSRPSCRRPGSTRRSSLQGAPRRALGVPGDARGRAGLRPGRRPLVPAQPVPRGAVV